MKLPKLHVMLAIAVTLILAFKLATGGRHVSTTAILQFNIIAMSAGAGFFMGWFISPKAKAFRTILGLVLLAVATLIALGDRGPFGYVYTWFGSMVAFWIGFSIMVGYWTGSAVKAFLEKPTTFGSAEWATLEYLEENKLVGNTGFRLGHFTTPEKTVPLHYEGDRHLMTIAPTRSGKGTTAIIENLLTYRGSALVIDPKGENAMITAAQRIAMGQDVYIVDPFDIAAKGIAARFNPMDWLDPNDEEMAENAMLLADALIIPDGNGDSFWTEEARAHLHGLTMYVATDAREFHNRHLGRVRDLLLLDGDDMKLLYQRMVDSPHLLVSSAGARCLQKEEKLMANVIASAQAQTHFLDSSKLRASLSASDFKFEDLKTQKMTIYLVLPADRLDTFNRWLRLLIQQAITVTARSIEQKPDTPILFLLDELTSLGRLKVVEQAFSLMAGFGMILWAIVQDVPRLKAIYGDSHLSLIANSGVIQYFGSRDTVTAELFSSMCGMTTVWNLSSAIARAWSTTTGKSSSSTTSHTETETTAVAQRKLAFPDELMRIKPDKEIVFIEHHNPIIGTRKRWFDDPLLKTLGRNIYQG